MTVQELMRQLIELPMEAQVTAAIDKDTMRHIDLLGVIPEGPLGIYKPGLVYLELGEEY